MNLIGLLVFLLVLCALVYVITQLPLPQPFKNIAMVIVCVLAFVYLLSGLPGVHGPFFR